VIILAITTPISMSIFLFDLDPSVTCNLGDFACGIAGLLLYLQQQQIISVNAERLEGSSTVILTTLSSSFDKVTHIGDMSSLGIPLAASIAAGFTVALAKS
jgi:uncharacterized membrane protein (Fun14 family)